MVIRHLFRPERDPTRHLNEVVNAEAELDPRSEIEEYVFTEHTVDYLRVLIDGILGTSQGVIPECLCGWIAGFFGSGKSHFLKLAGAVLANRPIDLGTGETVPALEYAVRRHRLDLPWERLAHDFKVRAVTVNLAMAHGGPAVAQRAPLFYRLASEINRAWGHSAVPHVAAIEREIARARKWKAFVDAVRQETESRGDLDPGGRPYEWISPDIRDFRAEAHRLLEVVLPAILPKYQNARQVLTDRESEHPGPEAIVDLAVEFARSLDPDLGRVLLCVDEVALYLKGAAAGFDADRVREVQGLAEAVKTRGHGRVFLLATAQLRVDTIDAAFTDAVGHVIFLRDRFLRGGRLELEERDIDTVVRERWLRKDPEAPDHATLEHLVRDHGGLLARATRLREENIVRDADRLTDAAAVIAYYPCLPYHIRLLQAILETLRGAQQIDQTAAQSRALLTAVRSLFTPRNGANLAEAEIGTLVTFDRVYDVIRDVVRRADSGTDLWITDTIHGQLGSCGDVRVSSVAKVIFLLQGLNQRGQRRILINPENIAALLYPRLGAPWEPHLAAVREACEKLHAEHFVGQEPEAGYRFYRPQEQTFQQSVDRQPVSEPRLRELLDGLIDQELERLGTTSLPVSGGHKLDVTGTVHVGGLAAPDPHAPPQGLVLHVLHPSAPPPAEQIRVWAAQYAAAPHIALWILASDPEVDDLARRALKLEAAIEEYSRRHGSDGVEFLQGEQGRLDTLREETLPLRIRQALAGGTIIHRGVDTALGGGKKPPDVFRETMRQAVAQVFPQLEDGCVVIDDASLRRTLGWRPPQPQPDYFAALRLFDGDGHPLVDRPFLSEIILGLRGRPEHERTGSAVLGHFRAAPYGWPERAVKAGLAALLRGRRLTVRPREGGPIESEVDPRAESWLTSTQQFNRAVLELSDVTPTPEERELLTHLFDEAFDAPGRDTIEKLEQAARDILPGQLARAREAQADLRGRQLPGADMVGSLVQALEAVLETDHAIGRLKRLAGRTLAAATPDSDGVAAFARPARIIDAVAKLRGSGALDALAALRTRAAGLYQTWDAPEAAPLKPDIDALAEQARSLALLEQPDMAFQRDARVFQGYARAYQERHAGRHTRAQDALRRLESHEGWTLADGSARDRLHASLAGLDCESPGTLSISTAPDGRCPRCRASLADLHAGLELLEAREQRALGELDALLARPAPPAPPGDDVITLTVDLTSADDLPELHRRIDEVGKGALARPRRVRVIFEDPR